MRDLWSSERILNAVYKVCSEGVVVCHSGSGLGVMDTEVKLQVHVRRFKENSDLNQVEALERRCEAGQAGSSSLFVDFLGDPLCRVRHLPTYAMLVRKICTAQSSLLILCNLRSFLASWCDWSRFRWDWGKYPFLDRPPEMGSSVWPPFSLPLSPLSYRITGSGIGRPYRGGDQRWSEGCRVQTNYSSSWPEDLFSNSDVRSRWVLAWPPCLSFSQVNLWREIAGYHAHVYNWPAICGCKQ